MTWQTFYDPILVGEPYAPDFQRAYQAGQAVFKQAAAYDTQRIVLWLIDVQQDFVFTAPLGRLAVPNAVEDTRRTVEWLYNNIQQVTHITASLDTHHPFHIFYAGWWLDANENQPAPFTIITLADVRAGRWRPVTEPDWSIYYLEQLEGSGKKQLMIWPYHCLEGTDGRALVPALSEAIMYHSAARRAQPSYLTKGTIAQTEFYSAVEPEVKYPQHPNGGLNNAYLNMLGGFDLIYVAGQARSHCVLETMKSTLRYFHERPDILSKIRFLNDCSSSIAGFEEATERDIQAMAAQGIRLVNSAEPIG